MKKILFAIVFLFVLAGVIATPDSIPETHVYYFYSISCSHCVNVVESGVLDRVLDLENVTVEKLEVSEQQSRDKFDYYNAGFGIPENGRGYPFLVIEQGGEYSYLVGDTPIIDDLENQIVDFVAMSFDVGVEPVNNLTLGIIIIAALIDSINPCAFGVLLFLMAVLLSMGSAKRAMRSGLIYTFVIFLVYLAAGFGIMRAIDSLGVLGNVKLIAGFVVLIGGLIELKDFFWEGKGISLKIPTKAKPLLEKYIRKGTLPALIILGALVALVELPCTGGIYLAILSLISESGTIGVFCLILYNLIFVLPLVLITYFVYKGARVDSVNEWVQKNKKFMRLATGLIMIFLALTLLSVI